MKAADLPPLAWYDLLLELRRSPDGLRAKELEDRTLLAQYNLSRLLDRLATAGYLARSIDPGDGRQRILTITASGLALLDAMWPVYAKAIAAHVGEKLSAEEAGQLADLLAKIAYPSNQGASS
ncbi:MAG: MarR family winged helix-turn-helix transcriptional regulator [Pseudomonadota bacterium]